MFNEIRAFNDHMAHVFLPDVESDFIDSNLERAWSHIRRTIFDCFKFINVHFFKKLKKLERRYKNVNFAAIKDGEFYNKYRSSRKKIVRLLKEAKKVEGINRGKSFELHQEAYNELQELDDYIDLHIPEIIRAKVLFNTKRIIKAIGWLITAIISGIISASIAYPDCFDWLVPFLPS